MVFVCNEKQFPRGVPGVTHREANDKCISRGCLLKGGFVHDTLTFSQAQFE